MSTLQKIIQDSPFLQGLPDIDKANEIPDISDKIRTITPLYEGNYDMTTDQLIENIQILNYFGATSKLTEMLIIAHFNNVICQALTAPDDHTFNEDIKNAYRSLKFERIYHKFEEENMDSDRPPETIVEMAIKYDFVELFCYYYCKINDDMYCGDACFIGALHP